MQTKLRVPPLRVPLVARPGLLARLDAGVAGGCRATLVSAPAGYGKTTLIADWLRRVAAGDQSRAVGWLDLEDDDNDLARFLSYLITALRPLDETIGQPTLAMLTASQPSPLEAMLTPLLNELAALQAALVFALDDYHLIQTKAVHDAVSYLVEHLPAQVHFVLLTREDPPLPYARWRGRGELAELRMEDLRLSQRAAASFLNDIMGLDLSAVQVTALQARTEGWAAGLQLAAVAMRGREDVDAFVRSFAGSNRYILDYLIEEVFEQQPPEIQSFLLATSILERFTAALCATVMGDTSTMAAQALLEHLEHANLFVVALDDRREWYRYHHLFADLLRHQLRLRGPDPAPLHRRAATWYTGHDLPTAAVGHFLDAAAWSEAAALLATITDSLLKRGETRTIRHLLDRLPAEVVARHPKLCLDSMWTLIFSGNLDAAEGYMRQAMAAAPADPEVERSVLVAQAYMARVRHDVPQTIVTSRRALAVTPPDDHNTRAVLSVALGIAHWQAGQLQEATAALQDAIRAARRCDNGYALLVATGILGSARAAQGQLRQAAGIFETVIAQAAGHPASAGIHYIYGALLYEWNDLEAVDRQLRQAVELAQQTGNAELQEGAYRQLARLHQARGDGAGALQALAAASRAAARVPSPLMQSRLADAYVQTALVQGDHETAAYWAAQRTMPVDASSFYPLLDLTPARLALVHGDRESAARHLAGQAARAAQGAWQYGLIETRLLQALAAPNRDAALHFLTQALTLAASEGLIRTFVDKGAPLAALLRAQADWGALDGYVQTLLAAFGPSTEPAPSLPREWTRLPEPLSERELEVLQLLARRRSNAEIAGALTVSVNTVKTHLQHVYGKLGVHDRRAAVTRARELGLL